MIRAMPKASSRLWVRQCILLNFSGQQSMAAIRLESETAGETSTPA
jgi:hypothetical protein